jgi:hypothetical protein
LLPAAFAVGPRRARHVACQWALAARFPAEQLDGLAAAARAAFEASRTEALWRYGELIGLTDGYRDAGTQARLFAEAVRLAGSPALAARSVLPPGESRHVAGTAMDVRPAEGARWLERHGARYHLYRVYDNEWWHFEYRPEGPPPRVPHPGSAVPGPGDHEESRLNCAAPDSAPGDCLGMQASPPPRTSSQSASCARRARRPARI